MPVAYALAGNDYLEAMLNPVDGGSPHTPAGRTADQDQRINLPRVKGRCQRGAKKRTRIILDHDQVFRAGSKLRDEPRHRLAFEKLAQGRNLLYDPAASASGPGAQHFRVDTWNRPRPRRTTGRAT